MRYVFAFLVFLAPVACVPMQQDGVKIIDACWHGQAGACQEHSIHQQSQIDANAIMLGMQSSSLRAATTQGRAR